MKVGEIIQKLQDIKEIELLTPEQVSNYQVFLSSMIWEAGNRVIETERAYNEVWNRIRETTTSDKQADKKASLTPEYVEWRKAIYAEKTVLETIRALKKKLQSMAEEAKNLY